MALHQVSHFWSVIQADGVCRAKREHRNESCVALPLHMFFEIGYHISVI